MLEVAHVRRLLSHVQCTRNPARNRVMVLLSFKAGLRAGEIAGLDWRMVLRPDGRLAKQLNVDHRIAKKGSGRRIPISPELRVALERLLRELGHPRDGPVIRSERGRHMTPRSVVNWFRRTYAELGMAGCSSHSGRRTFITRSARLLIKTGGSLRDVQELAGHRSLTTTERYIEGDRDAQRRLMRLI
ncbi:tyrosine-type recombinase/integrase [Sphingomonas sp. PB4P5]|uniref:tyrosine-type recombinase/integrase n=1 Tax=Parasphingomonas puruogangriensis TaxID=3096155 RepID=UPI002FCBF243